MALDEEGMNMNKSCGQKKTKNRPPGRRMGATIDIFGPKKQTF
jgi:hypothetical protein